MYTYIHINVPICTHTHTHTHIYIYMYMKYAYIFPLTYSYTFINLERLFQAFELRFTSYSPSFSFVCHIILPYICHWNAYNHLNVDMCTCWRTFLFSFFSREWISHGSATDPLAQLGFVSVCYRQANWLSLS